MMTTSALKSIVPTKAQTQNDERVKRSAIIPSSTFALYAPAPNPCSGWTKIRYAVPESALVRIEVFDMRLQHIAELVYSHHAQGEFNTEWNIERSLPSGTYFVRMTINLLSGQSFQQQQSVTLVK
jgi:hypothetical protein